MVKNILKINNNEWALSCQILGNYKVTMIKTVVQKLMMRSKEPTNIITIGKTQSVLNLRRNGKSAAWKTRPN